MEIFDLVAILATSAGGGAVGGGGMVRWVLNGMRGDVTEIRRDVTEIRGEVSETKERIVVLEVHNEHANQEGGR